MRSGVPTVSTERHRRVVAAMLLFFGVGVACRHESSRRRDAFGATPQSTLMVQVGPSTLAIKVSRGARTRPWVYCVTFVWSSYGPQGYPKRTLTLFAISIVGRRIVLYIRTSNLTRQTGLSSRLYRNTMDAESEVYDVIIVGAGPCGLATAARLREHTPAALFTDEEHRRYHWIGKYGSNVSLKHVRSGKVSNRGRARARPEYKMLVLDATDESWLGRWRRLFRTFDISHLRSPMLWHVDPLDRDALLAHAYREEREGELVEIRNCVGKEMSKHAKKKLAGSKACGKK